MISIFTSQSPLHRFIRRFVIFAALFIGVTGLIGPWIISTRLLYGFSFFIYGNLGKLVLFSAIAFLFYVKGNIGKVVITPYKRRYILYLVLGIVCIPLFIFLSHILLSSSSLSRNLFFILATHVVLVLSPLFLLLGIFSPSYMYQFLKTFKKEIIVCVVLAVIYDFSIFYIWNYWIYLSSIVLRVVAFLFSLSFKTTTILPPYGLYVKSFAVQIEAACSGLDSLFLFTSLYILIGLFEWKSIMKVRYFLLFIPALVGLFAVNILRVYTLIWVGIIFSPYLTLQLFHTYLGMVLFIIYFLIFMKLSYEWILKMPYVESDPINTSKNVNNKDTII